MKCPNLTGQLFIALAKWELMRSQETRDDTL